MFSYVFGKRSSFITGLLADVIDLPKAYVFEDVGYLFDDWSQHAFIISKRLLSVGGQGQTHKSQYDKKEIRLMSESFYSKDP